MWVALSSLCCRYTYTHFTHTSEIRIIEGPINSDVNFLVMVSEHVPSDYSVVW